MNAQTQRTQELEVVLSRLEAMAESVKHACPWSSAFLFLDPGCESIAQGSALAQAVETAMRIKFQRWAETWITPRIDDAIEALAKVSP